MNERDWEQQIVNDCRLLYADIHEKVPITQSLMSFGFEVNSGWKDLIMDLSYKLEELIKKEPAHLRPLFRACQVKEKLGSLRFYMHNHSTREMEDLISDAQNKSCSICETCGKPGTIVSRRGWLKCQCPEHAEIYLRGSFSTITQ